MWLLIIYLIIQLIIWSKNWQFPGVQVQIGCFVELTVPKPKYVQFAIETKKDSQCSHLTDEGKIGWKILQKVNQLSRLLHIHFLCNRLTE